MQAGGFVFETAISLTEAGMFSLIFRMFSEMDIANRNVSQKYKNLLKQKLIINDSGEELPVGRVI